METPNHHSDIALDETLYITDWGDIGNIETDYENYLDDIEAFFRDEFENDIPEDETIN